MKNNRRRKKYNDGEGGIREILTKFYLKNLKKRTQLGVLGLDRRIILELTFKQYGVRLRAGLG